MRTFRRVVAVGLLGVAAVVAFAAPAAAESSWNASYYWPVSGQANHWY